MSRDMIVILRQVRSISRFVSVPIFHMTEISRDRFWAVRRDQSRVDSRRYSNQSAADVRVLLELPL